MQLTREQVRRLEVTAMFAGLAEFDEREWLDGHVFRGAPEPSARRPRACGPRKPREEKLQRKAARERIYYHRLSDEQKRERNTRHYQAIKADAARAERRQALTKERERRARAEGRSSYQRMAEERRQAKNAATYARVMADPERAERRRLKQREWMRKKRAAVKGLTNR